LCIALSTYFKTIVDAVPLIERERMEKHVEKD